MKNQREIYEALLAGKKLIQGHVKYWLLDDNLVSYDFRNGRVNSNESFRCADDFKIYEPKYTMEQIENVYKKIEKERKNYIGSIYMSGWDFSKPSLKELKLELEKLDAN